MAGKTHQFILGLVIRKIRESGFEIVSIDGKTCGAFDEKYLLPPTILRHRPDVIGINNNGQVCIGEAKTSSDISNNRIEEQITDFINIELNTMKCKVIVGLPMSSKNNFEKKLKKMGMSIVENLEILYVPDEIIND